jgi:hypothetical protein
MNKIVNELGDRHHVLKKSYVKLQQKHDQEITAHRVTKDKKNQNIETYKEIEDVHNEIKAHLEAYIIVHKVLISRVDKFYAQVPNTIEDILDFPMPK